MFLLVNYSNGVVPKRNYFGYRRGPKNSSRFWFEDSLSIFTLGSSKERVERLSEGSQATLSELATDAPLEETSRCSWEKPWFLFGDIVATLDEVLCVKEHKWLQKVEGVRIFLSDLARSYLLVYLQKLLVPCTMNWHVTKDQNGVAVGNFSSISVYQYGPNRSVLVFSLEDLIRITPLVRFPKNQHFLEQVLVKKRAVPIS